MKILSSFDLLHWFPFVGVLLLVALGPIFIAHFWKSIGPISMGGMSMLSIGIRITKEGLSKSIQDTLRHLGHDYFLFILVIGVLYMLAYHVRITVQRPPTPSVLTGVLAIATLCAGIIGTTGACMIFVYPILKLLKTRELSNHTWFFFILLVGNIGGLLSTLGDPPLLMGFLQGVSFWWPTMHLFPAFFVTALPLLVAYRFLDAWAWKNEQSSKYSVDVPPGKSNIWVFLARTSLCFLHNLPTQSLVPVQKQEHADTSPVRGASITLQGAWFLGMMLCTTGFLACTSVLSQDPRSGFFPLQQRVQLVYLGGIGLGVLWYKWKALSRKFWDPLVENSILFAAIFITAIPVMQQVRELVGSIPFQTLHFPQAWLYFLGTGIFSAFLDNAPTYLLFFHAAGGDAATLMQEKTSILQGIASGAVIMGGLTYIGNAPNMLVKAIAAQHGYALPSFGRYMVAACICLLLPCALILFLVFPD